MSLFHPHHHTWEMISMAYLSIVDRDSQCHGNFTRRYIDSSGQITRDLVMKDITTFTQECTKCHTLRDYTIDGKQKYIGTKRAD